MAATRFLTIPSDVDISAIAPPGAPATMAFGAFFVGHVLAFVPWGTAAQQDTLDTLVHVLRGSTAGAVVELREADHAALVAALNALRAKMAAEVFLIFGAFFAAVARATPIAPVA